jgi:hypothetical protein
MQRGASTREREREREQDTSWSLMRQTTTTRTRTRQAKKLARAAVKSASGGERVPQMRGKVGTKTWRWKCICSGALHLLLFSLAALEVDVEVFLLALRLFFTKCYLRHISIEYQVVARAQRNA